MKKLLFIIIALVCCSKVVLAQDLQAAKKAFNAYNLNRSSSKQKLTEAVQNIQGEPIGNDAVGASFHLTRGDIMNEVATQVITIKQIGLGSLDELPKVVNPAVNAFDAYRIALQKAKAGNPPKKYEIADALKGLQSVQVNLYNLGIYAYEGEQFMDAYNNFSHVLNAHDLLKQNGERSTLDEQAAFMDQQSLTGLVALKANLPEEAKTFFEKLYSNGYDKPTMYEALYTLNAASDLNAAYKYLDAGRQKHPDDASLLFAEINHFLRLGRLDELTGKLKMAIEKEPTNLSLYTTLGNVYDNLYQMENEAGNLQKANDYFSYALKYYNDALARDAKYFDAIYSIGALYYNKAATKAREMQALSNDFSSEGLKKYEYKKVEVSAEFDSALPYFKKAESINPNDVNTLVALKEIFARKDDLPTSDEFKKRLQTVQDGGKNDQSFFKNQ